MNEVLISNKNEKAKKKTTPYTSASQMKPVRIVPKI